jgi:hypothetical protein
MRYAASMALATLVALAACTKAPAAASDPEFDRKWAEVSKSVSDTFYIEDDRAAGLMGNISRSAVVSSDAPAPGAGVALPMQLDMGDVSRTIRGNLTQVKVCYLREQRISQRSGKAIVTFDINTDGRVGEVKVTAPTFTGSNLPDCVGGQVKKLAFPKFQKGPMTVSYPFVFVGS